MERRTIDIGQRFERVGRWPKVWEVEGLKQAGAIPAHVMLREVAQPANKCTIAPVVLLDPARFRLVDQAEAKGAVQGTADRPDPAPRLALAKDRQSRNSSTVRIRSATAIGLAK